MRKITLLSTILMLAFTLTSFSSNKKNIKYNEYPSFQTIQKKTNSSTIPLGINNATITTFFKNYPKFNTYQSDVNQLYKTRNYNMIWFENGELIEFAHLLYQKVNMLEKEGVKSTVPYRDQIDFIFNETEANKPSQSDTELLLTSLYVFYTNKVYEGLDAKKVQDLGWFLPKKSISYDKLLDSLLVDPKLLDKGKIGLFSQYYKLRDVLDKYRQIQKTNDWEPITMDPSIEVLKPLDSSKAIGQIRHRLLVLGDIKQDSKRNVYDQELMDAVLNYKRKYGLALNYKIDAEQISQMNEPIEDRIRTIMLNMERCRWIPAELEKGKEYVMVNIPSYRLYYVKDGANALVSDVFVGSRLNKTVIFSSKMDRIVFSPYWTVPQSIVKNELKSLIASDKNYLKDHNMEWFNGTIRQKPGPNNSLGLVKFLFPNPNDIYMHDTPAKSLFLAQDRAFSHGCINVQKAKELAVTILKGNPDWPIDRIDNAMSGEKETVCMLKDKIPVYIGYFTAWVNNEGEISFFKDVYDRDKSLASLLFPDKTIN
ncbi:L,D-transpeptidase family protein [Flavobacterium branchiarum]|uniref:Murein L,D-transpeptidase n=1 Tax=Flavobacterium branchiarum TaxID=1114870 RepID=A0ABV5FJ93_9FLAO|nr:L,D-transpeptidase family protein [Flavobacterium branchiarum]MDN3675657.1 L,D-transpeptidase family protein [Flavobacterium branchiarum]